MIASYILSRTLVPTLAMYLLRAKQHDNGRSRNPFIRFQQAFERGFERLRNGYRDILSGLVARRAIFIPVFFTDLFVVVPADSVVGRRLLSQHR